MRISDWSSDVCSSDLTKYDGVPAAGLGVQLATGANALQTANAVRPRVKELSAYFPAGLDVKYPYDTTPFVKISIEEVVKTMFEGIVLRSEERPEGKEWISTCRYRWSLEYKKKK